MPDFGTENFEITEIIKTYRDKIAEEDLDIAENEIKDLKSYI